jgi:hypothetical protein
VGEKKDENLGWRVVTPSRGGVKFLLKLLEIHFRLREGEEALNCIWYRDRDRDISITVPCGCWKLQPAMDTSLCLLHSTEIT